MINRRGRDGSVYWRCTRSRNSHCNGTIITDIDDRLVFIKDTHNKIVNFSITLEQYLRGLSSLTNLRV